MASNQYFLVLVVAVVLLPSVALATTYVVGDEAGWTLGFDYQAWAQGKEFHVSDKIVFHYPVGVHNVFKVNGTSFQACTKPPLSEALTSGSDVITLATPGRKWYICGVGPHCAMGQKLFITVQPEAMTPSMPPTIAPSERIVSPEYYPIQAPSPTGC